MIGGLLLTAVVLRVSAAPRRRRLGEALDLQGLRRLADDGALGSNILYKLDGESSFIAETAAQCAEAQQQRRHLRFGFAETGEENCTAAASDALAATCVEINQCVGCTREFFTKSFLGDDACVLARSSGEEPASPRHRAGIASTAWRTTRRFSANAP